MPPRSCCARSRCCRTWTPGSGGAGTPARPAIQDPLKDARVRRLALQALTSVDRADQDIIARAVADPDPQVRLLAVRATGKNAGGVMQVMGGLKDWGGDGAAGSRAGTPRSGR